MDYRMKIAGGMVLGALVATGAEAQDAARAPVTVVAPQAPATPAGAAITPAITPARTGELGDIVVTARRREESLQSVPVSVTALGTAAIEQAGLRQTEDLVRVTPGLNVSGQQRGDAQFYLRGQGPAPFRQGLRLLPGVPTYFLEVPSPVAGPGVFYDLSNVQVLKGPQGTLFGRNSTGGAVLFTPHKPEGEFGGYVNVRAGNHDMHEIQGALNLPLAGDTLLLRVAGEAARRDGFTRNVITGQRLDSRHYDALRVSLVWRPSDTFETYLVADGRNIDQSGSSAITTAINPPVQLGAIPLGPGLTLPLTFGGPGPALACLQGLPVPGCPAGGVPGAVGAAFAAGGFAFYSDPALQTLLARQQALGPRKEALDLVQFNRERARSITDISTLELGESLTLKNIFGFRSNRINGTNDLTGFALPIIRLVNTRSDPPYAAIDQYSNELQVQGKALDGKLSWIGGYYFERAVNGSPIFARSISFGPPAPAPTSASTTMNTFRDTSNALFGHVELDLGGLVHGLGFSGGLRQTWDRRKASIVALDGAGACTQAACPVVQRARFSALTWDATLQFKPVDGVLGYAAIRRGFKSGGFNLPAPAPDFTSYAPEYVTNHELGVKADFRIGGVPVRTNIAAFHDDYRDLQLSDAAIVNGQFVNVYRNAASANIDGVEFEGSVAPAAGLNLGVNYSYTKAVFASDYFVSGVNARGRQLVGQPRTKYGATVRYETSIGDLGDIALSGDFAHIGRVPFADLADPRPYSPGYGVLNARVEWNDIAGKPLDLALFATNLTNKLFEIGGFPLYSQVGFRSVLYGEPRMFGAQLRVRFGRDAR